jgi:hypothetical protein
MREPTKAEWKAFVKQEKQAIRQRNENLRQASTTFGFLTIGFFIGAVFTPAEFAIYLIGAAAFCGLMRYITSKLAG